jgi:hypothetical protein
MDLWRSRLTARVSLSRNVQAQYVGPNAREGELVFGVAHIYASFNDTFVVRARTSDATRRARGTRDDDGDGDGAMKALVRSSRARWR